MYVNGFSSGTEAIFLTLKEHGIYELIIAQDMCPQVIRYLLDAGFKVTLAKVERISEVADYYREYDKLIANCQDKKIGIIFSHPYGIYRNDELLSLVNKLRTCDIIINDCCLCNITKVLALHKDDIVLPAIFSFGYSKVIDLGGGGLCLSKYPMLDYIRSSICKPVINRYGECYEFDFSITNISIKDFLLSDIYSKLYTINNKLDESKSAIRIYLKGVFRDYCILDSDWRFIVLTNKDFNQIENLRCKMRDLGVFLGINYPINNILNNEILIDYKAMNILGWPLNIFIDHRVDLKYLDNVKLIKESI